MVFEQLRDLFDGAAHWGTQQAPLTGSLDFDFDLCLNHPAIKIK